MQINPFTHSLKASPCIPDVKTFPSEKFYLRKRGTFASSAASTSAELVYILLNPWTVSSEGSLDAICTTNGTVRPSPAVIATTGTGVVNENWDSPYSDDFARATGDGDGQGNELRVVGAGIRVSYAGIWDQLKGTIAVFKHPTNDRNWLSAGTRTFTDVLKMDDTAFSGLTHNTVYQCVYHPMKTLDFDYNAAQEDDFVMGIVIQGGAQGAVYSWEAIAYYEMIGPDTNGNTPSMSDVDNMGAALSKVPPAQKATDAMNVGTPSLIPASVVGAGALAYGGAAYTMLRGWGPPGR